MQYSLPLHSDNKGFTVLELMVGIVIFTLWFLGAYLLVDSANTTSIRSRDEIIGANIMREQIELIKNLRDTNWIQFRSWDSTELAKSVTETETIFTPNTYYTIENNFLLTKTLRLKKLSNISLNKESIVQDFLLPNSSVRLCMDTHRRYTHDCSGTNTKTNFASFFVVEPLITKNTLTNNTPILVERSHKITTFFVSFNKGYHITSMSTVITDWKNQ